MKKPAKKPCPGCAEKDAALAHHASRIRKLVKTRDVALDTILALKVEIEAQHAMLDVLSHALKSSHTRYACKDFSERLNSKEIQQFLTARAEMRRILETGRDDTRWTRWFPVKDVERMRELCGAG